jgi:hypothetical protein
MLNTISFATLVNNYCSTYRLESDYGNELFLYYVVPKIEREFLGKSVDESGEDCSSNKETIRARGSIIEKFRKALFVILFVFFFLPLTFLGGGLLLVFFLLNKNKSIDSKLISVIRTKAAWSKIKSQKDFNNYCYIFDDFSYKTKDSFSLYNISFGSRLACFLKFPFEFCSDMYKVFLDTSKFSHDWVFLHILKWLIVRVPHKIVYGLYLKSLLLETNCQKYLSGNKEDRYAILEKRLCAKLNIPTVCIPHGLEYGFKMPKGLFGDLFYCTSEKSKTLLEGLYSSNNQKFVFDNDVAKNMFGVGDEKEIANPKLVFFPESREIDVNLDIIRSLAKLEQKVYLKLHPSDSIENYSKVIGEDCTLNDLDEALNGNICLARRSTVLLESAYRNGYPCAILFNLKDKIYVEQVFPSLANHLIKNANNLDELKTFLKGL